MSTLLPEDLNYIVRNLPKDVRRLMEKSPGIYLAGGFIRAMIAGEKVADIDLWGRDKAFLDSAAELFAAKREVLCMTTENAHTILTPNRTPVQFITRWVHDDPVSLAESFDYTIAQVVVWYGDNQWNSWCGEHFYPDLAAKRLRYTCPVRNEDAGGSLLRMTKFLSRGYKISPESMGKVIGRLTSGIKRDDFYAQPEEFRSRVLISLLREVDPLLIVDGVEPVEGNDNAPPKEDDSDEMDDDSDEMILE
jgi:hypothetical protein